MNHLLKLLEIPTLLFELLVERTKGKEAFSRHTGTDMHTDSPFTHHLGISSGHDGTGARSSR